MKKLLFAMCLTLACSSVVANGGESGPASEIHYGTTDATSLSGMVADEKGAALDGAYLTLHPGYLTTFTDPDGGFTFRQIKEGRYKLLVSHLGYEDYVVDLIIGKTDLDLNIQMVRSSLMTREIVIRSTSAHSQNPLSYDELDKAQIEQRDMGYDLPFLLEQMPSVVVTSDAGTGIGYTGLRIRGSDPTRINVTINGIPLNDSESQGVYWVDLPDIASSADNLQVQRGVGTSTNGAGAFGASVNLNTNHLHRDPYARLSGGYGSFNSWRTNLAVGSGLLKDHFAVDARLSYQQSDGYIDRATANLGSYFVSAVWLNEKQSLRFNTFGGHEKTYQAWGGVPVTYADIDSLRTFNPYTYDNEVDDYTQVHNQLFYSLDLGSVVDLSAALHYTRGNGYFEQFKADEDMADYGIAPLYVFNDTIMTTDLIRRRWLDNDFYGFTSALQYKPSSRLDMTLGGAWNRYEGAHFGEVIWAEYAAGTNIRDRYYDNDAIKKDGNAFVKLVYNVTDDVSLWGDVQYRAVNYSFQGPDENGEATDQSVSLQFVNPKAGIVFKPSDAHRVYASFAVGHHEPSRDDYVDSSPLSRPSPERLYDIETGYSYSAMHWQIEVGAYYMMYKDQLLLTGQINDVGDYSRINVPDSYRMGIEISSGLQICRQLLWQANMTLSRNRLQEFTEYVDDWDTYEQIETVYENSPLSFSPDVIAGSTLNWAAWKKEHSHSVNLSLISKVVGRQYLDNTGNDLRSLDPYHFHDIKLDFTYQVPKKSVITLSLMVRNILDAKYSSNGWVYHFNSDGYDPRPDDPYVVANTQAGDYSMIGLYPQAGINFISSLKVDF